MENEIDYTSARYFVNRSKEEFVTEAKKDNSIDPIYHSIIPEKCSCGCQLVISHNLKTLRCPNLRCKEKLPYMMSDMLTNLGIKNAGLAFCTEFLSRGKWKSHLVILLASFEEYPLEIGYATRSQVFDDLQSVLNKVSSMTLKEFVSKLELPRIKEMAYRLFDKVNSADELIELWGGENGVTYNRIAQFVAQRIGSQGDLCYQITNVLYDSAKPLVAVLSSFDFAPDADKEYIICVTGDIWKEQPMKRDDFPQYVKTISGGHASVRIGKALASAQYVIADDVSNSRTYRAGKDRGILISSKDFCDKVRCV